MTIKFIFERSSQKGVGRGFVKRVNRGPTLKFYCRPKAQDKQHFEKSHFYCCRFFPLQASRGPEEFENYCRREFLSFRRLLSRRIVSLRGAVDPATSRSSDIETAFHFKQGEP